MLLLLAACTATDGKADDSAHSTPPDTMEETGDSPGETQGDTSGDTDTDTGGSESETADSETSVPDRCPTLSPVATPAKAVNGVLTVTWSTDEALVGDVEWGYDAGYGYTTWPEGAGATAHTFVVAGLAAGETIHWRARVVVEGEVCASDDATFAVDGAPNPRPDLELTTSTAGFQSGWRLFPLSGNPALAVIVDDAGRVVWSWEVPDGLAPTQALFDADHTHVNLLVEDDDHAEDIGGLYHLALDGSTEEFLPLSLCHHGFAQLADGSFVFIQTDPQHYIGQEVAGDAIVHVEGDGTNATELWSSWTEWTPDLARINAAASHYYLDYLDWTHANSVRVRADGSYLVSFHALGAIVNLEPDGTIRWVFAGADPGLASDFAFSGALDELFLRQHSAVETSGGILVFDNGMGITGSYSESVEFALDEGAMTAARSWAYAGDEATNVTINGDHARLSNGNTLTNWGSSGFLAEVTPAGDLWWELRSNGEQNSAILGFSDFAEHLGGPVGE